MTEHFRPLYHFTPPAHWMNDPNGLVYFEGEWHLFYQYNPDGKLYWGHAVSTDLTRWTHLPVALSPDEEGVVFSGSAVVDHADVTGFFDGEPGLVALWTRHGSLAPPGGPEAQCLSFSRDRGRTWVAYDGNPVVPNPHVPDFRDPKVSWHEASRRWVMALAVGQHVEFYVSPDLKAWERAGEFGDGQGSHAGVWECPDLFELPLNGSGADGGTRWVLIVSISGPAGSQTQYFVGDFDGRTFVNGNPPETVLWADHGADNYAAVSWSDVPASDGRRVWIGWMSNWLYGWQVPTEGWQGAMTLPRVLGLRATGAGLCLTQTPVRELEARRGPGRRWEGLAVSPGENPLAEFTGDAYEIAAEWEAGAASAFGFRVRAGGDQRTTIGYDASRGVLFVDRSRSGKTDFHPAFAARHEAALAAPEGCVSLRVFVDRSSVEVFAQGGETVITDLIFPDPASLGLEAFAEGGEATLNSLTVYPILP